MATTDQQNVQGEDQTTEGPLDSKVNINKSIGYSAGANLVELDFDMLRSSGMVVPDEARSRIKEEYRYIKRPLLLNVDGKGAAKVDHPNLIMLTSANPGEGKTFTAVNLALSIAMETDRTVLLVDADFIRSSASKFFGIDDNLGLVEYLNGDQSDLSKLLVKTNVPKLTFLPAGTSHHLSTELLASTAMKALCVELAERYPDRIVIFDCPPLLVTSEAAVMSHLVGQIAVVVEAEVTRQAQVKEAISRLGVSDDAVLGFILNKTKKALGGAYYYYYYGYYGYYADY